MKKTGIEEVNNSQDELFKVFDYSAKFMIAKEKELGFQHQLTGQHQQER